MVNHDFYLIRRGRITESRVGSKCEIHILNVLHLARSLVAIAESHGLTTLTVAACAEIEAVFAAGNRQHFRHATALVADKCRHIILSVIKPFSCGKSHIEVETHVVAVIARIDAPCVSGRSRDTMEERNDERDYRCGMSDNRTFHVFSFLWFSVRQSYDRCNGRRCRPLQHRRHPSMKKCRCHYH